MCFTTPVESYTVSTYVVQCFAKSFTVNRLTLASESKFG